MGIFDWDMTQDDFNKINERIKDKWFEDDIFGFVFYEAEKSKYLIDIHYEKYGGEKCFDIEIYHLSSDGGHGEYLGWTKEIKSSCSFERFKKRAEKAIVNWINDFEEENHYEYRF